MRNVNINVASALANANISGSQVDANQLVSASFHAYFSNSQGAGTFKLQASNDIAPARNMTAIDGFTVTNWVDIPNQSANITSGTSALLTLSVCTYRWIRPTWTSTATGIQTIGVLADVAGSLQSKYFLLNSANGGTGYYVWFNVSSGGVDPAIAGRTGVPVAISTGDSAAAVGTALASAVDALANFIATGTTTVTVTNSASGPFTAMSDGAAPTGFTFTTTVGGGTMTVNMDALSV